VEANVVPFRIGNEEFEHTWITADCICPAYSRFVKGIKEPTNQEEKRYTSWQEAVRKDVERAVGILQGCWQFLERSILLWKLEQISYRVTACIILHNMLVSDIVMEGCRVTYNPSNVLLVVEVRVNNPNDLQQVQAQSNAASTSTASGTGIQSASADVVALLTRSDRFKALKDVSEYQRLQRSLIQKFAN
jgi:hypothetical protein